MAQIHFVDYLFELKYPDETIRRYEWRGILKTVKSLTNVGSETRWLDYGCGNGGFVRYCIENASCKIIGFEEGWIKTIGVTYGIPYVNSNDLEELQDSFDIVTAIEVLEHIKEPHSVLTHIKSLLKPGGLFFFTTGNSEPFRDRLLKWKYIIPEIHISFYEPQTLNYALKKNGFRTEFRGFTPGFTDIIRFKILKNLYQKRISFWERFLPWQLLARIVDKKYRITHHPIGWA